MNRRYEADLIPTENGILLYRENPIGLLWYAYTGSGQSISKKGASSIIT